jgi:hypothetical protein
VAPARPAQGLNPVGVDRRPDRFSQGSSQLAGLEDTIPLGFGSGGGRHAGKEASAARSSASRIMGLQLSPTRTAHPIRSHVCGANRPAPHAHPSAHNIDRLSPGKQDAIVAEMTGVAMLRNSGTPLRTENHHHAARREVGVRLLTAGSTLGPASDCAGWPPSRAQGSRPSAETPPPTAKTARKAAEIAG